MAESFPCSVAGLRRCLSRQCPRHPEPTLKCRWQPQPWTGTPFNGRSSCIGMDRYIPTGTHIRQAGSQAEALHPSDCEPAVYPPQDWALSFTYGAGK